MVNRARHGVTVATPGHGRLPLTAKLTANLAHQCEPQRTTADWPPERDPILSRVSICMCSRDHRANRPALDAHNYLVMPLVWSLPLKTMTSLKSTWSADFEQHRWG